jgi:hypothetical protein
VNPLEAHHRRALARELTAAAGAPLRDRYGFAASDATVDELLTIVFTYPNVNAALCALYENSLAGRIKLAMDHDTPTDEDYERRIVEALRPLVADRRRALAKTNRPFEFPDDEEDE